MKITLKSALIAWTSLTVFSSIPATAQSAKEDEEDELFITSKSEAVVSLDTLMAPAFWQTDAESIATDFKKKGFEWLDSTTKSRAIIRPKYAMLKESTSSGDSSTFVSYSTVPLQLQMFGRPVFEANIEFTNAKPGSLTVSVWNKGDARQELTETNFKKLIADTVASMDSTMQTRGKDMGKDPSGAIRLSRWRWENPSTFAQLEYTSSKAADRSFQAEFVRVRMVPKNAQAAVRPASASQKATTSVNVTALLKNIKKTDDGDIYISNVPMVDQGMKGYCAVASTERVMRYYGISVDQHELANAAATTAGRGTNPKEFEDALHSMQGKLGIRVRDLISFDRRDFEKLVQNYNREAKRLGGKFWAPDDYFFDANPDILREARCRNGAYEKFLGYITAATDRGYPLLWALHLGRYPETGRENPQGGGGHMRTIIGYNKAKDEVIFTDSWGEGHEFKKMSGRDACGATLGLYLIDPTGR